MFRFVRKRNGELQAWDETKIRRAVVLAFEATPEETDWRSVPDIVDAVKSDLADSRAAESLDGVVPIETIQDSVEMVLMESHPKVAKRFILYREERAKQRAEGLAADKDAVADYIHPAKYGRWQKSLSRRETFDETVTRTMNMHIARWSELEDQIVGVFDLVREKRVLPSMRCMQFAGESINRHNARMYNCCFTHASWPAMFGKALYLLLCGCGVGVSVQFQHVDKLPEVAKLDKSKVHLHKIDDSIEGWGDAVNALVDGAYGGYWVEFDYTDIIYKHPEGSELKTSGGKAPGHLPLRTALEQLRELFAVAEGRKLRPIEVGDAVCYLAECVLAGGIRRSSLILLFSHDDGEMMYAKHPHNYRWGELNAHRGMSNNSAVLLRDDTTKEQFDRIVRTAMDNPAGEPGFYFTNNLDYGTNPCGEIGLDPVLRRTDWVYERVAKIGEGMDPETVAMSGGTGISALESVNRIQREWTATYGDVQEVVGFSFCNLCEVNCALLESPDDLYKAARAAAFIGTLQAAYTSFPYLGRATEEIARRDALLGVGLTGVMDRPEIGLNPHIQRLAANKVTEENIRVAGLIGIRPAKRATCVKPSGTASLELGCVGSGIHYHHSRRYFRRITANPLEAPAQYFKSINPHMVEVKPNGDWCLVFCVEAPPGAKTVKESTAMEFMDAVFSTYDNWVAPGGAGVLTHNVSATVTFRPEEREAMLARAWENKHRIAAMSFLPLMSDKGIPYMPREEVTALDEARWRFLVGNYKKVDYSKMIETDDGTAHSQEAACQGGACEVTFGQVGGRRGMVLVPEDTFPDIVAGAELMVVSEYATINGKKYLWAVSK